MEQKKLLLIAISVGVFFVIVIGAALVAFRPAGVLASASRPQITGAEARPSYTSPGDSSYRPESQLTPPPAGVNAPDYPPGGVQGLKPAAEAAEAAGAVSPSPAEVPPEAGGAAPDNSGRTLITVDPKSTAGVPNVSAAPKQSRPAPARQAAKPAAAAAKKPAAQSTAARPAASSKTRDDYWVQTGAFTAMSRAEGVKETLAEKGITSIIENRDIEGTTYFRVRIGPYTSQNEADYWLSLIKSIGGFEDSQVRKTQTRL